MNNRGLSKGNLEYLNIFHRHTVGFTDRMYEVLGPFLFDKLRTDGMDISSIRPVPYDASDYLTQVHKEIRNIRIRETNANNDEAEALRLKEIADKELKERERERRIAKIEHPKKPIDPEMKVLLAVERKKKAEEAKRRDDEKWEERVAKWEATREILRQIQKEEEDFQKEIEEDRKLREAKRNKTNIEKSILGIYLEDARGLKIIRNGKIYSIYYIWIEVDTEVNFVTINQVFIMDNGNDFEIEKFKSIISIGGEYYEPKCEKNGPSWLLFSKTIPVDYALAGGKLNINYLI